MKNKMKISERDIYLFAFSPDKLTREKLEYLTENESCFLKEISLCRELKASKELGADSLIKKIIEKINFRFPVELFPQIESPIKENGVKLAAASVLVEKPRDSVSYVDQDSKYLIRIVKTDSKNLLFLFSSDKSRKDFSIQILPCGSKYNITATSNPIEITDENVEKIIIM